MTDKEKTLFEERIKELILKHETEMKELQAVHKPIGPENAIGRISRMDAIHNKSIAEAAIRTKKEKISNLKHALSKLHTPNFGQCSRCGQDIKMARLIYMPESNLCMRCAR